MSAGEEILNVEAIDAETETADQATQEVEAPAVEVTAEPEAAPTKDESAEATEPDNWDAIMSAVGDIPEDDAILSQLTPKQIAKLPPEARGIVRMAIGRSQREYARRKTEQDDRMEKLNKRAESIKTDAGRLLDERAKLADIFATDELKTYLDDAKKIDPNKLDLLTREGRAAFLQREAAEGIRKLAAPITNAALRAQREQRYRAFRDAHPQMADKAFREEVLALGKQMEQAGTPVLLEDAYNRVLIRKQRVVDNAKRDQRRRSRAEAMKHVSKRTVSSTPAPEPFTAETRKSLRKKGYVDHSGNKHVGEMAVTVYLREHPESLKVLMSQQKKRRARR